MIKSLFTATTVLLTATTLLFDLQSKEISHEYPETFIVTETDRENNIMYLRTFSGEVFTWENCEDWEPGDIASAIMDSNGTETIKDDSIVMLKYSGYIY